MTPDTEVLDDDVAVRDGSSADRTNRAERIDDRHPRDQVAGREKGRDMRSLIKSAIKEHAEPAVKDDKGAAASRDPAGKFAATEKARDGGAPASPAAKPVPEAKTGETAPPTAEPTASAIAAPATAPKEVQEVWSELSPKVQTLWAKREADMKAGVDKLQQKYKPFDDAFAPVQDQLQRMGKTAPEAAKQLLDWQAALANPATQGQAFRALAQAHKFDLSTLASPQAPGVAKADPQPDPSQAFRSLIDPYAQKVTQLETEFQRRDRERVQSDIASLSKDKPHFDRVRVAMGHFINSGLAKGDSTHEVFDAAYQMACRADPEVFSLIQQDEQGKREADAKATQEAEAKKAEDLKRKQAEEVAKARKANVGPRAGSPQGMAIAAAAKGTSVRESLTDAIRASGGRI